MSDTDTNSWQRRYRQAGRDAGFLLLSGPVLLGAFLVLVPLSLLAASTTIIWVGVPLLAGTLLLATRASALGRWAVAAVDGSEYLPGGYQQPQPGDRRLRRLLLPLRDPQRWLDLTWVVLGFGVTLVTWSITVVWVTAAVLAPVGPLLRLLAGPEAGNASSQHLAGLLGLEPVLLWACAIDLLLGALAVLTAPYVLRLLVQVNQLLARALLCSRSQVARLETSRAALWHAESDTRRRLERDLHDGPQQRLVRLGMDLARAQRQLRRDPQAAEDTIAGAMAQTQETLDELRRLSRGIASPVLVDRGLAAALADLASRSAVPVQVQAQLPRLPEHVEQTAYFVASEALANLNKHAGASVAELGAAYEAGRLRLWVADDGCGGADLAKGHGLAGLRERLEGVGGQLLLSSPPGGPTRVEAVVPCAS